MIPICAPQNPQQGAMTCNLRAYIGHLGLGGVGDSKGILELPCATMTSSGYATPKPPSRTGKIYVTEHDDMGIEKRKHELPFAYSMMLPAFKGVDAVFGIEG